MEERARRKQQRRGRRQGRRWAGQRGSARRRRGWVGGARGGVVGVAAVPTVSGTARRRAAASLLGPGWRDLSGSACTAASESHPSTGGVGDGEEKARESRRLR